MSRSRVLKFTRPTPHRVRAHGGFWPAGGYEAGIEFAGLEVGFSENATVQRDGGIDALDDEHFQRPPHELAGERKCPSDDPSRWK